MEEACPYPYNLQNIDPQKAGLKKKKQSGSGGLVAWLGLYMSISCDKLQWQGEAGLTQTQTRRAASEPHR